MKELNAGQGKLSYSGTGQPIGYDNKQSKSTKKLSSGKKHPVQKI